MRQMPTASTELLVRLATEQVRAPVEYFREDDVDHLVFDPPLTSTEQTTYDILVAFTASTEAWTAEQYNAVRSQMQGLRDLRQMGRNAFMALSAAERDRLIYDRLVDVTIVLLAMLRDS